MSFGAPIWLMAAAGLLIPVLIHWWRSRSGRVLEIASVRFLEKGAQPVARRRRLQDLLLLLIRCLLFIVAAAWLATPLLPPSKSKKAASGWLLISDDVRTAALTGHRKLIDSLLHKGYELRALQKDFPLLTKNTVPAQDSIPYFSLLDAADRRLRDDQSLFLLTGDVRARFGSSKPALAHALTWRLLPVAPAPADTAVVMRPQTVAIHAGKAVKDAVYLEAALAALRHTAMPELSVIAGKETTDKQVDWLFWLDTMASPPADKATHVLQYAGGAATERSTWMSGNTLNPDDRPPLYRQSVTEEKNTGRIWWRNAAGEPVLWSAAGNSNHLYFASRFDPAWNNLVWSPAFPEWLAGLFDAVQHPAGKNLYDNPVQEAELQHFNALAGKAAIAGRSVTVPDLLWIIVLLALFTAERLLTYRKNAGA